MGRTYFALLEEMEARRFQVFGERVALPTRRRIRIALRHWVGAHLSIAARGERPAARRTG